MLGVTCLDRRSLAISTDSGAYNLDMGRLGTTKRLEQHYYTRCRP